MFGQPAIIEIYKYEFKMWIFYISGSLATFKYQLSPNQFSLLLIAYHYGPSSSVHSGLWLWRGKCVCHWRFWCNQVDYCFIFRRFQPSEKLLRISAVVIGWVISARIRLLIYVIPYIVHFRCLTFLNGCWMVMLRMKISWMAGHASQL